MANILDGQMGHIRQVVKFIDILLDFITMKDMLKIFFFFLNIFRMLVEFINYKQ